MQNQTTPVKLTATQLRKQLTEDLKTMLEFRGMVVEKLFEKEIRALAERVVQCLDRGSVYEPIEFEIINALRSRTVGIVADILVLRFSCVRSGKKWEYDAPLTCRFETMSERNPMQLMGVAAKVRHEHANAHIRHFASGEVPVIEIKRNELLEKIRELSRPSRRGLAKVTQAYISFMYRFNVPDGDRQELLTPAFYSNAEGIQPNHYYFMVQEIPSNMKISCVRTEKSDFFIFRLVD